MKIRRAVLLVTVSVGSLLAAPGPAIEFSGVLSAGGKTRVALTNTATKTTTWLEPGQIFSGYTIAQYDPKQEVVLLKKGTEEIRLALVSAKTPDVAPASSPATSVAPDATASAVRANLRLLESAARQYQLTHGVTSVNFADLVGPNKLIKELKPVAGENYSALTFGTNLPRASVLMPNGTIVALDTPATAALPAANTLPATTPAPALPIVPPLPSADATGTSAAGPAPTPQRLPDGVAPATRPAPAPNYTIQNGDTWQRISESTGVPVSQLKQLNPGIVESSPPPLGQTIRTR
jgi:hypothetical protein